MLLTQPDPGIADGLPSGFLGLIALVGGAAIVYVGAFGEAELEFPSERENAARRR